MPNEIKKESEHNHGFKSKFQEAFDAFTPIASPQAVNDEIARLINLHRDSMQTKGTARLIHSLIDLTTLSATDHADHVYHMVSKVNELDSTSPDIPPVASICVYPNFVATVREFLGVEGVGVCAVSGGFPSSQTFTEIKVAETALAVKDGANEIDIVLHVGNFLAGDYNAVVTEIEELRDVTRDVTLKVILETGALGSLENIQRASIISLFCGADFIKTSTGKEFPGASLPAAYVMATVLKEYYEKYGIRKGLKISGGVRTVEEAIEYLCIVKGVLGEEWLNNELFRFGASSLEGNVLKALQ
ncbi:MAG: deoxyribose-phosphate aldolase [Porphyromonas sp.]|nr:deoxyribose-phosphate aldolase [Porphyromonas sp.]